jgi:hypothetical protein
MPAQEAVALRLAMRVFHGPPSSDFSTSREW